MKQPFIKKGNSRKVVDPLMDTRAAHAQRCARSHAPRARASGAW